MSQNIQNITNYNNTTNKSMNNHNMPINILNNILLNPFNNPFLINSLTNSILLNLSGQGIFNVPIQRENIGIKDKNIINLTSKEKKYKRKEISNNKEFELFKSDSDEKVDFNGEKKKVKIKKEIIMIRKMKSII